MARTGYDADEVIEWIPPGEEKDEKPFTVLMTHVSYAAVQTFSRMISARVAAQSKGLRDMTRLAEIQSEAGSEVQKIQFLKHVKEIKNYFIYGLEIKDAETFYAKADNASVTEVIQAMESSAKLSEGQVKNSKGASGGISSQETKTESPSDVKPALSEKEV